MLEELFEKYKKKFLSRTDEIKEYLSKNYKSEFTNNDVIKVERVDTTKRLEKAGFHKNLSSWKNAYGNVFVCSCEIIDDKKKRFDYKFYFVDEKLDEKELEIILDAVDEADKLTKRFQFDAAVLKVDETLDSIKRKKDEIFNKKLTNKRREILATKNRYENGMAKIAVLERMLEEKTNTKDFEEIANYCKEIFKIAKSIKKRDLTKKYENILESTNQKIKTVNDIRKSDKKLTSFIDKKQYEEALKLIEIILKKTESIEHEEFVNQYSLKKEKIEEKIQLKKIKHQEELRILKKVEEISDKVKELAKEAISFLENDEFDNSFNKFQIITKIITEYSL